MAGTVEMDGTVSKQTDGQRGDTLGRRLQAVDKQTRPTLHMKAKYMGNKWKGRTGEYKPEQTNVQGRQLRQRMQEMEWDRRRRDSGTHRDGGKPRCS